MPDKTPGWLIGIDPNQTFCPKHSVIQSVRAKLDQSDPDGNQNWHMPICYFRLV